MRSISFLFSRQTEEMKCAFALISIYPCLRLDSFPIFFCSPSDASSTPKPPVLSPKPEVAKRFSFNKSAPSPAASASADSPRSAPNGSAADAVATEAEMDAVRKFSTESQFKSLDDLKSNKIMEDVAAAAEEEEEEEAGGGGDAAAAALSPSKSIQPPSPFASISTRSRKKPAEAPPLAVDETALFKSLEPSECKEIEEEFDKLTVDSELETLARDASISDLVSEPEPEETKRPAMAAPQPPQPVPARRKSTEVEEEKSSSSSSSIPFADEDTLETLTVKETSESSSPAKATAGKAAAVVEAVNREVAVEKPSRLPVVPAFSPPARSPRPNLDSSSDADEFGDEIHFDPTISSGHMTGGDFRNTPIAVGLDQSRTQQLQQPIYANTATSSADTSVVSVDEMTPTEAEKLLSKQRKESTNSEPVLSDEQAKEVVALLTPDKELPPLPIEAAKDVDLDATASSSDIGSSIESWAAAPKQQQQQQPVAGGNALDKLDSLVYKQGGDMGSEASEPSGSAKKSSGVVRAVEDYYDEQNDVTFYTDGHYWFEIPAIDESSAREALPDHCYKAPSRLRFSSTPLRQYSTHAVEDYDRRNEDVDPAAASAEYELEKRVEKMDTFPVDLNKGSDGLGLSIIGMGVGADAGLEKLGIFIKTITPGGAAERDGRIQVNDQIIEVDGQSLVGVTQAYAASVLRNTSGVIQFVIGRDKDPENSEVAQLIRQSLQVS